MPGHSGQDIHVYIDETGDRGSTSRSSPIFGMAAVLLDRHGAVAARRAARQLRADFSVPSTAVLSWKQHVKTHDRRRRAVEVLRALPGLRVCYVYSVKNALRTGSYLDHPQRFYNYVAFQTYKSVLWAARSWKGPSVRTWTRFGHVKGHDHHTTDAYIRREAQRDPRVPFEVEQGLRWVSADKYAESQIADLYQAALWPHGEFGYVEPTYLLGVWHQIRASESCAIPLGIMSMPRSDLLSGEPWFPCRSCAHKPAP